MSKQACDLPWRPASAQRATHVPVSAASRAFKHVRVMSKASTLETSGWLSPRNSATKAVKKSTAGGRGRSPDFPRGPSRRTRSSIPQTSRTPSLPAMRRRSSPCVGAASGRKRSRWQVAVPPFASRPRTFRPVLVGLLTGNQNRFADRSLLDGLAGRPKDGQGAHVQHDAVLDTALVDLVLEPREVGEIGGSRFFRKHMDSPAGRSDRGFGVLEERQANSHHLERLFL